MPLLILRNPNFDLVNPVRQNFLAFFKNDHITSHTVLLWETKEISSSHLYALFKYYKSQKFKEIFQSLEDGLLMDVQDPRHLKYSTGMPVRYLLLYDSFEDYILTYNYIPIPKLSIEKIIQEKNFGNYTIGIIMLKYDQTYIVCKYIKAEKLSNWVKV